MTTQSSLSPEQVERYKRHILLPEIGGAGQQKLRKARLLVVGAGGLGCPILSYLVAAGVGQISICDPDLVALSNLQRQVLFCTDDIGKPKAEVAARHLARLNPDCTLVPHSTRLDDSNAAQMIAGHDLVIEGVDNFQTRYALNRACLAARVPLVSAAIGRFEGQVAVFAPWAGAALPCYQCFVPEEPPDAADCEAMGVLGVVPGVVGALAAGEALKELTGFAPSSAGRILLFNGLTGESRAIGLRRDPACPACAQYSALPSTDR